MKAPKHLWSGDWERESAAASDALASLEELPRAQRERPAVAAAEAAPGPVARPAAEARPAPVARRTAEAGPAPGAGPKKARSGPVTPRHPRRLSPAARRATFLAITVMAILAVAGYGLAALLDSSGSQAAPAASGPGAPMSWLGMEVETVSPGGVVVATVAPGSRGEHAGFEPGDVIRAIDSRAINSTADIAKAIFGMQAGQTVDVEVTRGSTVFSTRAVLGAPPAKYP